MEDRSSTECLGKIYSSFIWKIRIEFDIRRGGLRCVSYFTWVPCWLSRIIISISHVMCMIHVTVHFSLILFIFNAYGNDNKLAKSCVDAMWIYIYMYSITLTVFILLSTGDVLVLLVGISPHYRDTKWNRNKVWWQEGNYKYQWVIQN